MHLSVLHGLHLPERHKRGSMLMHPDFPIEQMVRSTDPGMRSQLSQDAYSLRVMRLFL